MKRTSLLAFLGFFYLIVLVIAASVVFLFYPESQWSSDISQALQGPSWVHWFGTDSLGRDLLLRTLAAAQISLWMGLLSSFLALLVGVVFGFCSGWWDGKLDMLMMRFLEILHSLPQMVIIGLLALVFSGPVGSSHGFRGLVLLSVAIALGSWMNFARLTRNMVLREKSLPYIDAAVVLGSPTWRILWIEMRPNLLPTLLIMYGLQIPNFLLFESALSFLGVGLQPPLASWGILVQEGWRSMLVYPHLLLAPSSMLFLTIFSLNIVFEQFRKNLLRPFAPIDTHH